MVSCRSRRWLQKVLLMRKVPCSCQTTNIQVWERQDLFRFHLGTSRGVNSSKKCTDFVQYNLKSPQTCAHACALNYLKRLRKRRLHRALENIIFDIHPFSLLAALPQIFFHFKMKLRFISIVKYFIQIWGKAPGKGSGQIPSSFR